MNKIKIQERKKRQSIQTSLLNRERQWDFNCIEKRKKLYANKYKLNRRNIYDKVFNFLNEKIKYQIEINEKRKKYNTDNKDAFYNVNKYDKIYNTNSRKIISIIKNQKPKQVNRKQSSEFNIIKHVKTLDVKLGVKSRSLNNLKIEPKVYNHDKDFKFFLKFQKLENVLSRKASKLKKKLNLGEGENFHSINFLKDNAPNRPTNFYSKNAYLASLNYDFSNPII